MVQKERKSLADIAKLTADQATQDPQRIAPGRSRFMASSMLNSAPPQVAGRKLEIEIDPKRCRPWKHHNRHQSWYTAERCADLIESIPRDGQKLPGLVRKLEGEAEFDYEVIYGMRRRFACEITGTKFLVVVSNVDDQEAARLQHIENADKRDISAMERAISFAAHLGTGLFATQDALAQAFNLKKSLLSQMLSAAEIFTHASVQRLFPDPVEMPLRGAYQLSTLLKADPTRALVLKAADNLSKSGTAEQKSVAAKLKILLAAPTRTGPTSEFKRDFNLGDRGSVTVARNRRGKVTMAFPKGVQNASRDSFLEVMSRVYEELEKAG